jgi:DNA-binding GntR family transcriptional regulator
MSEVAMDVAHTRLAPLVGHRTLEEQTYQRLREGITRGALVPGTKLVGSQISVELGVSRITVANALKRLASEGFVVVTPHKEAAVASLDATSLREVYAVRHALEDLIMRAAAAHVTDDALCALHDTQTRLLHFSVTGDLAEYRKAERAFHIGIYDAANLPLAAAILTDLWDRVEPYRGRRYVSTGLMNANHDEHIAILDALEQHDAQRAVDAMHHHVATGFARFLDALKTSDS